MIIANPAKFDFTLRQGSTYEQVFDFKTLTKFQYTFNASATDVSGTDDYGNTFSYVAATDDITLCLNDAYLSKRFYTLTEPGTITYDFVTDDVLIVERRSPIVFPTVTDVRMTIRRSLTSSATLVLTLANGNFVVTEASGRIELKITDEETESVAVGDKFIYDMEVEDVTGDVTRVAEGEITFSKESTYTDA